MLRSELVSTVQWNETARRGNEQRGHSRSISPHCVAGSKRSARTYRDDGGRPWLGGQLRGSHCADSRLEAHRLIDPSAQPFPNPAMWQDHRFGPFQSNHGCIRRKDTVFFVRKYQYSHDCANPAHLEPGRCTEHGISRRGPRTRLASRSGGQRRRIAATGARTFRVPEIQPIRCRAADRRRVAACFSRRRAVCIHGSRSLERAGAGITALFAAPLVYNTKRSGTFELGGRKFVLRRVAFPRALRSSGS